ncbi:MAG: hypothetical protein JKY56_02265, partial [Kofleriaceae bacterium]|nr:hypothetical protein [Kofleriaceae bacterium]
MTLYKNSLHTRGVCSPRVLLLGVACLSVVAGCFGDGDRDEAWNRGRSVIGPLAIKNQVVYVDTARDRVISLESFGGTISTRDYAIGRNAIFALPAPDRQHLAVITRGEEALIIGQVDEQPKLWMVNVADSEMQPRSFDIGSPFDRLALSSDGSVAIAYFSSGGFDDTSGVFRNPNEIAVVDLKSPASDSNPVLRTLRSFGAAPDGIVLSPPMVVPGAVDQTPRIFAFVLAQNTVTILDATHASTR